MTIVLNRTRSARVVSFEELFVTAEEKDSLRRLALREKYSRPTKVAPIVQDARKVKACLRRIAKDTAKRIITIP